MSALVSTIIPVHNRAALLRQAVESVVGQTYPHIEIIIVNDGSTDDTAQIADDFARALPEKIKVIHQANGGPGSAREAGRIRARGEFIQYLDSDDLLLPRKFELQVESLLNNPQCGVCYGRTRFFENGRASTNVAWKRTGEAISMMFPSMLESRWWGTSTPLYRRTVTDKAGPWLALLNEEDWEYDCRIATQQVYLSYIPEFISEERNHDGPRLSQGGSRDKKKLKARAAAHALILKHARGAGIKDDMPEMQHFAREMFLLSRQCGAAGLAVESKELFGLAKSASGLARAEKWDFKLYELLAAITGWRLLGKMVCFSDSFRK